jgi:translation initiation factor 1
MRMSKPGDVDFNPLKELDLSEARIVIKREFRRYGKPVTVIQGLPSTRLQEIASELKQQLGAGGTTKNGVLQLQGDHRSRVRDRLVKLGFPADHIDLI